MTKLHDRLIRKCIPTMNDHPTEKKSHLHDDYLPKMRISTKF